MESEFVSTLARIDDCLKAAEVFHGTINRIVKKIIPNNPNHDKIAFATTAVITTTVAIVVWYRRSSAVRNLRRRTTNWNLSTEHSMQDIIPAAVV